MVQMVRSRAPLKTSIPPLSPPSAAAAGAGAAASRPSTASATMTKRMSTSLIELAGPGPPRAPPGRLERRLAREDDADDQAEERGAFEQGGDDDHGRLDLRGLLRLAGHALQGGGADLAEAEARPDDRQAHTDTGRHARAGD